MGEIVFCSLMGIQLSQVFCIVEKTLMTTFPYADWFIGIHPSIYNWVVEFPYISK